MLIDKSDFNKYPKFRHNLWTSYESSPETTYLIMSNSAFEVPTEEANLFLKIRSFCTGHNTIEDISIKSAIPLNKILSMINSMKEIDAFHLPYSPLDTISKNQQQNTLISATNLWAEQLEDTHISHEIFSGKTSKNVVIGWLLETYHYVKTFPEALEIAAKNASSGLKDLLTSYAKQEKGHEKFILESLMRAGITRLEVESSIPLISTRTIDFLLKELFTIEPCSVLLVAGIIEADDYNEHSALEIAKMLNKTHQFPIDMLEPFFEHVKIDFKYGHHKLLENNLAYLQEIKSENLNDVVNKLHDIKHAFDVQRLEIFDYYNKVGNYLPRQYVDFFAI